MYSGDKYAIVVTVLHSKNMNEFLSMTKAHRDTFVYFSDGVKVQGDFRFGCNAGGKIDAY